VTSLTRERRMFPRVALQAPVFARSMSRTPQLAHGATFDGRLLNASRGGVAFAAEEPVAPGELVELAVRLPDGDAVLERYGRVVGCDPHPEHGLVVRCQFVEPTRDESWISALTASTPAA
jgi:hypothetical protein